jgi:hypothetical protein
MELVKGRAEVAAVQRPKRARTARSTAAGPPPRRSKPEREQEERAVRGGGYGRAGAGQPPLRAQHALKQAAQPTPGPAN